MISVSQGMIENLVTVHRDHPLRKAFGLMTEGWIRRLSVMEETK